MVLTGPFLVSVRYILCLPCFRRLLLVPLAVLKSWTQDSLA